MIKRGHFTRKKQETGTWYIPTEQAPLLPSVKTRAEPTKCRQLLTIMLGY